MPYANTIADMNGVVTVLQKGQLVRRTMHARVQNGSLKLFRAEGDNVPDISFKLDSHAVIEDSDPEDGGCAACACLFPQPEHQFALHVKAEHVTVGTKTDAERMQWIQTLVKNGCKNQTALTEFAAFDVSNPSQDNPALRNSLSQQPQNRDNPLLKKDDSTDKAKSKAQRRGSVGSGERRMSAHMRRTSMQRRGSNGMPVVSKSTNADRRGSSTDLVGAFQLQLVLDDAATDDKAPTDTPHVFAPVAGGMGGFTSLDAMLGQVQQQRIAKEGGSNAKGAGVAMIAEEAAEGADDEGGGDEEVPAASLLPFVHIAKSEVDAVLAELVMSELKNEEEAKNSPRKGTRKMPKGLGLDPKAIKDLTEDPLNETKAKKVIGEGATMGPEWKPVRESVMRMRCWLVFRTCAAGAFRI
jgi:hypothetical protein